jgi:hypothetical protein
MTTVRKQSGIGSLTRINPIKANNDSNIVAAISALFAAVNTIIDAFNGFISMGDGTSFGWAGNLDAVEVEWMTPSVANTEFSIPHLLGRIPVRAERTRADRACDVYDSGTAWTKDHVYLKCSVASALVLLRIS